MHLVATLLFVASTAIAQEVVLDGAESACPAPDAVAASLGGLVPGVHVVGASPHATLRATLRDRGDTYSITMTSDRTITDRTRRCVERARAAALVIALALEELPVEVPVVNVPRPALTRAAPELPWAVIDRPVVMPYGGLLLKEEIVLSAAYAGEPYAPGWLAGASDQVSFDVGLGHRLQLGGWIGVPVQQGNIDLSAVPHLIVAVRRNVSIRIELGFERTHSEERTDPSLGIPPYKSETNGVFFALAPLARVRLHRMLALTFGDAGPRDEWATQISRIGSTAGAGLSWALVSLEDTGAAGLDVHLCFPLGVLFQPHHTVALLAQVGVHLSFMRSGFERDVAGVPVSLDVILTPFRRLDLGLSVYAPLELFATKEIDSAAFIRIRM